VTFTGGRLNGTIKNGAFTMTNFRDNVMAR